MSHTFKDTTFLFDFERMMYTLIGYRNWRPIRTVNGQLYRENLVDRCLTARVSSRVQTAYEDYLMHAAMDNMLSGKIE